MLIMQAAKIKWGTSELANVVGNTPLFRINRIFKNPLVNIYAKLEWMQLGGSVKTRPAFNIIDQALKTGELDAEKVLLDASSGNTAISYAAIGAALGIRVAICLPENASKERITILKAHGAELIFTSMYGGTDEAQIKAKELVKQDPGRYYYADQYNNPNNWKAHYDHTAEEIIQQTNGAVTHLVVGLGTSGTAMGIGKKLKEYNPEIELITLQPDLALHNLEGWKHMETAIVPGIYDPDLADDNLEVDSGEALMMVKKIARKEGLLVSPSSAANLVGAIKVANQLSTGTLVTIFPDNAEKYSEVLETVFNEANH
jgi:cysteine synthase B